MATKSKLFIFNRTEGGAANYVEIDRSEFNEWLEDHTRDIVESSHPKFINTFPNYYNKVNEFLVIEGRVIVPKAITVVQSYTLDGD